MILQHNYIHLDKKNTKKKLVNILVRTYKLKRNRRIYLKSIPDEDKKNFF